MTLSYAGTTPYYPALWDAVRYYDSSFYYDASHFGLSLALQHAQGLRGNARDQRDALVCLKAYYTSLQEMGLPVGSDLPPILVAARVSL